MINNPECLRPACVVALIAFFLSSFMCTASDGATLPSASLFDEQRELWNVARERMETILTGQDRMPSDLESPPWYEVRYNTIGRMPLIDTCLREPFLMPDVALWADEEVSLNGYRMVGLLTLADRLATRSLQPLPNVAVDPANLSPEVADTLIELENLALPAEVREMAGILLRAQERAAALRESAFASVSTEDRAALARLLPGYFVFRTPVGESIRGYTTSTTDCIALIRLLGHVRFGRLLEAATIMADAADRVRDLVEGKAVLRDAITSPQIVYRRELPAGMFIIGGSGVNVWSENAAVLIDLGGDDIYLNQPATSSLLGYEASVFVDLSGNDTYRSDGPAQGSAIGGVSLFMDLEGNDRYLSGHYSQGAALGGYSLFYEGGGDDIYDGDLGVQCFAIFGASIFVDRAGRDTYRCAANGQGSASTLGVALMVEGDGDDCYRAGGKYGFYFNWDSSTAQGAASGMRPWPPTSKLTVYGGIGFLSERSGNDTYHAYNIGQGGSYVFGLGMLVDSDGHDTYTSKNYCRGVGVHLSAGVAIDRSGDDLHNGLYGQNGYSLDRSSGVFVDFQGNDTYRTSGGIGFGHKPRGTGIFVDFSGDDTYAGWENNYGKADWPFGDDQFSSGFFLDFGGKDRYPEGPFQNNAIWNEGDFGHGEDTELVKSDGPTQSARQSETVISDNDTASVAIGAEGQHTIRWTPDQPPLKSPQHDIRSLPEPPPASPGDVDAISVLYELRPLDRLHILSFLEQNPDTVIDAVCRIGQSACTSKTGSLIDLIQMMIVDRTMTASRARKLACLLNSPDRDMRLIALQAIRAAKVNDPAVDGVVRELATIDPITEVRAMACQTLGTLSSDRTIAPLHAALSDPQWPVRRRAAMALAERPVPQSRAILAKTIGSDPSFQVRAYAAMALGKIGDRRDIPLLEKLVASDPAEFVRCLSARSLLLDFSQKEALTTLIDLLDWPNRPMAGDWVHSFLLKYTGQTFPASPAPWREWWSTAGDAFDAPAQKQLFEDMKKARELWHDGSIEQSLTLYRDLHRRNPANNAARKELLELIGSLAWEYAVTGRELDRGLVLAREAVEIEKNNDNLDTLAVLLYLSGERDNAMHIIKEAVDQAPEAEKQGLEARLEEFRTNRLMIR